MTQSEFNRHTCMSVDVQAYSGRNDRRQLEVQDQLRSVLDAAADAARLHRRSWRTQEKGDEELAVISADQPERMVVEDYVRELGVVLYRHNCDLPPRQRLRLRLAVDHGPVAPASYGFAGQVVVTVSRLVNAAAAKQALRLAPEAHLATVLSDRLYADLVLGGHTALPPELFRRIIVREKEFCQPAWLRVPGADVHQLPLDDADPAGTGAGNGTDPEPGAGMHATASNGSTINQVHGDMHTTSEPEPASQPAAQSVVNVLTNPTDATGATFGIRNG